MTDKILPLPLSIGCYDGSTIMNAIGVQIAQANTIEYAREIVRAVNCHAELVAVLEDIIAHHAGDRSEQWRKHVADILKKARATE